MRAFIYAADCYCEDCGNGIRADLTNAGLAPATPDDERTYDSNDFPKGPFEDGGGEADSMQHCAGCRVCLRSPLTQDGVVYTLERLADHITEGRGTAEVLDVWAEELGDYTLSDTDAATLTAYRTLRNPDAADPELVEAARGWVGECQWRNVDADELAAMPAARLLRGLNRHYHGGLAQFIRDGVPV